jgi:N-acetylmuramoyl-L-alanine amidase
MSDEQTGTPVMDEFTRRLQHALRGRRDGLPRDANPTAPVRGEPIGGDPATWGPIGQGESVVQGNDCMSSLAARTGHIWQTIWDEPANTELRSVRVDPNVLAVGDRVTIPPLRPKAEPGQTEMRHRFVRLGQPTVFQLRLADRDRPLAHRQYTIQFDNGDEATGATSSEGFLRCRMPSEAKHAKLTLAAGESEQQPEREYELNFGTLEPVAHLRGVQQRLRNLGFFHGPPDGTTDPRTRKAIEAYQKSRGLPRTGEPDEATQRKLQQEHGS